MPSGFDKFTVSFLFALGLLLATMSEAKAGAFISGSGGVSTWDCQQNDCELEGGSEQFEVLGAAIGYQWEYIRLQLDGSYRRHQVHGLNGPACERDTIEAAGGGGHYDDHRNQRGRGHEIGRGKGHRKGEREVTISRTGSGIAKCQTERNLHVGTIMASAYPTLPVYGDRVSLYAGGGLGVIMFDTLGQFAAAPGGQAGMGVGVRVYKGLTVDVGYHAIFAFNDTSMDGYENSKYASHGPSIGLRFEFN